MRQYVFAQDLSGGVCAQRQHDDDAARAGGYGKGKRIKCSLLQAVISGFNIACHLFLRLIDRGLRVFLIQKRPAHGGQYKASRDLDNRQRDAEEAEHGRAKQLDDGEEEDRIDRNAAGQRAIDLGRNNAYQSEKYQRRTERIDDGKQRAESKGKVLPKQSHSASFSIGWQKKLLLLMKR